MNTVSKLFFRSLLIIFLVTIYSGCNVEDGTDGQDGVDGVDGQDGTDGEGFVAEETIFSNKSPVKPLIQMSSQFGYVEAYTIMTTTDAPLGANGFKLAGSVDGAGFLKNETGDGYIYVVNCEDSYSVARLYLDDNLKPVSGDYLLNSGVADLARQCSGTMWEKEIHGGSSDLFLSASEAFNYSVKGIDPRIATPTPTADFALDALGQFSWENAVPLPKDAFPGQTIIIGGDDDSDETSAMGQVTMYRSTNSDADFDGGKIYVLRFKEVADGTGGVVTATANTIYNEGDLDFGGEYAVEFVEIPNGKELTVDEMGTACVDAYAAHFMRVEDVDYQKGSDANGRNVFFAVTGKGPNSGDTFNNWGTVYKLVLDATNPLEGKLTQIVSGNTESGNQDGNLAILQSPDNLCVTENFVYIQEDPNSDARGHTAYIYQTNLNGHLPTPVMEFIVRQDLDPSNSAKLKDAEYGSLTDISDKIGVPDTFILALQPHYWESDDFMNLDGHLNDSATNGSREDDQASQIIILKGLPR